MYQNKIRRMSRSPDILRGMSSITTIPRRGRPAAASRDDVLAAALHRYLRGRRVDLQAIAAELGLPA